MNLATVVALRTLPPLMKARIPLACAAVLGFALLGFAVAGCTTPPASARTAPVALEPSAKPGIHTEYLKAELNVTQWVERFEREGWEIYDQRNAIAAAADIGDGIGLFTGEMAAAGFEPIEAKDTLKENYVVRFRKIPK